VPDGGQQTDGGVDVGLVAQPGRSHSRPRAGSRTRGRRC
jgi:hypothetical protein